MLKKSTEALFSIVCFSLLNILFLLQHYSDLGCICVLLTVAYYFFSVNRIIGKTPANTKCGISELLGVYLGAFAMDIIAILAFEAEVFESRSGNPIKINGELILRVIIIIAEIIALKIIDGKISIYNKIWYYVRYLVLFLVTIFIFSLSTSIGKGEVVVFTAVIVITALMVDSINKAGLKISSYGFVWACVILIAFNIVSYLYKGFGLYLVDLVYNFNMYDFSPWYVNLLAICLLLICAVATYLNKEKKQSVAHNIRIYISMASSVMLMWILNNLSTDYDMFFLVALVVANFAFLYYNTNERNAKIFGFEFSSITLEYIGITVLILLLPVSLYFGWLYQHICVCVGVIGCFAFYAIHSLKKGNDAVAPHKTWGFWQFVITVMALYTCIEAYFKSDFAGNYIAILFAYAIASFALLILNYENKLSKTNHSTMRIVIAVAAIVFLYFAPNQSGIAIDFSVDDKISETYALDAKKVGETEQVELTIDYDEDNKLEVYYYWSDAKDKITKLEVKDEKPNYIKLQNGCLNVVCEDENGVVTTANRWFFEKELVVVETAE